MHRSFVSRVVASSTALLLLGGLSGCFLLPLTGNDDQPGPTRESTHESDVDEPVVAEVGDCWQTSYSNLATWATWEGDGRVDCAEDHQSYTYVAQALLTPIDEAFDNDGFMTNELALVVSDLCLAELKDQFGWKGTQQRLNFYFFVPTKKDWNDGDHRIRCDIAIKQIGSIFFTPELEDLDSDIDDLKRDLRTDAVHYQLCLVGSGFGPLEGEDSEIADCAEDEYNWRWAGLLDYPGAPGEPYPFGDDIYSYALDECPSLGIAQGESVYPYTPSPDAWAEGDRSIECWFSTVEVPSSSV